MPKRQWPGVCIRKGCACDLIFTYKCLKNYHVCVSCREAIPHPHYKKIKILESEEDFNTRIRNYGLISLGSLYGDYFSMSKIVVRAMESFLAPGDSSDSASDTNYSDSSIENE